MNWFHATGVCGKATANVTLMFKRMGWFVTGTDIQFSPPASTLLEKENVPTVEGYHFSHLTKQFWEEKLGKRLDIPEKPDLALIVESATAKNKEYLYAKRNAIVMKPFSQILGEYLVKPNSIVVIGTAGKTTTTAMIVKVLKELDLNPSYMIGADVQDFPNSLENTDSEWSVLEGDEYFNHELANGAKFLEYKPKYLVITNIGWEHHEIFPTQERYIEEFAKAVALVPEDGLIVAKYPNENIDKVLKNAKCEVVRYGVQGADSEEIKNFDKLGNPIYYIEIHYDPYQLLNGNSYSIVSPEDDMHMSDGKLNLIGDYNFENALAANLVAWKIPSISSKFKEKGLIDLVSTVIADFKGPKKRLEVVYSSDNITIIDDFGVAPDRARNSLKTINQYYPDHKIIAIFEPNAGSRPTDEKVFKTIYKDVFDNADELIIPKLSDLNSEILQNDEFVRWLRNLGYTPVNLDADEIEKYIIDKIKSNLSDQGQTTNDNNIEHQTSNLEQGIVVLFFSAYRMTPVIAELVKKVNSI